MAYFLSEPAPGACDFTAKNRVWGFFANPNKTHPVNCRNPQQLRQKNRPTPTKTVSGIPLWPSRDPFAEDGGLNLYGFGDNNPASRIDVLGMSSLLDFSKSSLLGLEWLTGLNGLSTNGDYNHKQLPWSWFDKDGSERQNLTNLWIVSAIGKFTEYCDETPVGETREWQYVGKVKLLGNSEIPWISGYWGYALGDVRLGNKNVTTWKWKDGGKCKCKVSADFYMYADDTSNFDKGKKFGPFGWAILKDRWFMNMGYNYYIYSPNEEGYSEHDFEY